MFRKALLLSVLAGLLVTDVRAGKADPDPDANPNALFQGDPIRDYLRDHALDSSLRPEDVRQDLNALSSGSVNVDGLAIARQRYWDTYQKGGPEFLEAKAVFLHALFLRDLVAVWTDISEVKSEDRLLTMMLGLIIPPGEGIPASARDYFGKWSSVFHSRIHRSPGPGKATNIDSIIDAFNQSLEFMYPIYQIARDWAEESMAPFPIPIEQFRCVSCLIFSCRLCAARIGGPCNRSVPVMSR